jgi:hypothetical protein
MIGNEAEVDQPDLPPIRISLEEAGFRHPNLWARFGPPVWVFLIVLASFLCGSYFGSALSRGAGGPWTTAASPGSEEAQKAKPALEDWSKGMSVVVALVAVGAAGLQWRAARQEISLDKYYDRLDAVNKRLEQIDGPGEGVSKYDMYVFTQLDLLEYVSGKYRLSYLNRSLAERALRAFASACEDPPFHGRVQVLLRRSRGYEETTRDIVKNVCRLITPRPGSSKRLLSVAGRLLLRPPHPALHPRVMRNRGASAPPAGPPIRSVCETTLLDQAGILVPLVKKEGGGRTPRLGNRPSCRDDRG